jgi:DnaD/phage-associated family protein
MVKFKGFPTKTQYTPIPVMFFSDLLPQITDINELKLTLHIIRLLYTKRGFPRYITYREMLNDKSLVRSLNTGEKSIDEVLGNTIDMAAKRGTILHLVLDMEGSPEDVYFLNTESDRRAVAKIQNGELIIAGLKSTGQSAPDVIDELPDLFTLYEQNIGMLTPMIAEELREAEKTYPESWIRDAIKEATLQGVHKWSYITAILERWAAEGKKDGTYKRDTKKTDRDRYIKGKYGHMVKR